MDKKHHDILALEQQVESLQNRYAQATTENAVMHQALVCIIDAWDSDDDSMCADPAEIARSALEQICASCANHANDEHMAP